MQIQNFFSTIGASLFMPMQIAVALALIYQIYGVSMFFILIFLVGTLPMAILGAGLMAGCFGSYRACTDARVKLTNEVLAGVRVVKYYA